MAESVAGRSSISRPLKRKRNVPIPSTGERKLLVGDRVEVRSIEEGLLGSWHPALIIACDKSEYRLVEYDNLVRDDDFDEHLSELLTVSPAINGIETETKTSSLDYSRGRIRPVPPLISITPPYYSLCVDAYHNDSWWEGVVFDSWDEEGRCTVFFPDQGDEMRMEVKDLRLSQDWNESTGRWGVRGNWVLMEVLEEMGMGFVSVKQVWDDVRLNKEVYGVKLKDWISPLRPVWEEVVKEVMAVNVGITAKEILEFVTSSSLDEIPTVQMGEVGVDELGNLVNNDRQLVVVPFNDQKNIELVLSESQHVSNNNSMRARQLQLQSMEYQLVPCPKYLPNSISEFLDSTTQSRKSILAINLRKHLLHLGWSMRHSKRGSKGGPTWRYISPDGNRIHTSLSKVAQSLSSSKKNNLTLVKSPKCVLSTPPQPSSSQQNKSITTTTSNISIQVEDDVIEIPEIIEPEHCPEIVTEYLDLLNRNSSSPVHQGQWPVDMVDKARRHLAAKGWSFKRKVRRKDKAEWYYYTPESPPVRHRSLRTALEKVMLMNNCESSSSSSIGLSESKVNCIASYQRCALPPLSVSMMIKKSEEEEEGDGKVGVLCTSSKRSNRVRRTSVHQKWRVLDVLADSDHKREEKSLTTTCSSNHHHQPDEEDTSLHQTQTQIIPHSRKCVRPHNTSSSSVTNTTTPLENKPLTILSFLIANQMLRQGSKVYCAASSNHLHRNGNKSLQGKILNSGIKCQCCKRVVTLAEFRAHSVLFSRKPSTRIFLPDGTSLLEVQVRLMKMNIGRLLCGLPKNDASKKLKKKRRRKKAESEDDDVDEGGEDDICSVCHYGGYMILCDYCPAMFHKDCVGVQVVPSGKWICPACKCGYCDQSRFDVERKIKVKCERSCHQCQKLFHISCLSSKGKSSKHNDDLNNGIWLCCRACEKVYDGIQNLVGKPIKVGPNKKLTWTLVKPMKYDDHMIDWGNNNQQALAENYCRLRLGVEVMHECFNPFIEHTTGRDVSEDVIFARGSDWRRLNFKGFYTIMLEKKDAVVSVATVRIFGNRVAEVPLVGTRNQYRRQGMCRILMNELEKRLKVLGVERIVLPAIPSVLETWTGPFGYSQMSQDETRDILLPSILLNFPDTVMCQKLLLKTPPPPSMKQRIPKFSTVKPLSLNVTKTNPYKEENIIKSDDDLPLAVAFQDILISKSSTSPEGTYQADTR